MLLVNTVLRLNEYIILKVKAACTFPTNTVFLHMLFLNMEMLSPDWVIGLICTHYHPDPSKIPLGPQLPLQESMSSHKLHINSAHPTVKFLAPLEISNDTC